MHAAAQSPHEIRNRLLPAMKHFKKTVKEMKLKLSPKAAFVTSCKFLDTALHSDLSKLGLKFVMSAHSRDLGISMSAGKIRPCSLQLARQRKSKNRILKIAKIANITRTARTLYTGSGFTTSTWGHQASGVAETKMYELEPEALACSILLWYQVEWKMQNYCTSCSVWSSRNPEGQSHQGNHEGIF